MTKSERLLHPTGHVSNKEKRGCKQESPNVNRRKRCKQREMQPNSNREISAAWIAQEKNGSRGKRKRSECTFVSICGQRYLTQRGCVGALHDALHALQTQSDSTDDPHNTPNFWYKWPNTIGWPVKSRHIKRPEEFGAIFHHKQHKQTNR